MAITPAATRWAAIIAEQERSGLTIRAYAEAHDLNPSTLGWWRSRLGRAHRPQPAARFAEVEIIGADSLSAGDRTVVVALERLDVHVVVDRQTDLGLLRQVLEALC